MRWTHNPPRLFKKQRRGRRSTVPSAASFCRLCADGGRLLSSAFIREPYIENQAGQSNNNRTKHRASHETEWSKTKRKNKYTPGRLPTWAPAANGFRSRAIAKPKKGRP